MNTINENTLESNENNEYSEACNDYVNIFDNIYTNNHIQILKALMPFMSTSSSYFLPVFIKYLELQYTLHLIESNSNSYQKNEIRIAQSNYSENNNTANNIQEIYNAINKYLAPGEAKSMSKIINTLNSIKNFQEMQQIMELINSEGQNDAKSEAGNIVNSLNNSTISSSNSIEDLFQLINLINKK